MVPVLKARGYHIRFFGWERRVGEFQEWRSPDLDEQTILRGGGYASRRTHLLYPLWMIAVFLHVLRLGRRTDVFCLGWETAFPALLASYFTGARIIFDDADRFSLIMRLPGPLHRAVQWCEQWTSRRVALHIVPGFSRYEWRGKNMAALRNAPSEADYAVAGPRRLSGAPATALVIYANGWIGETRGAPVFLEAMRRLEVRGANVRMIIAGRVDGPAGRELISLSSVEYRGELSQRDALAIYHEVDLALTFYDPRVPINRLAESNKWGDCVVLRTPFIVNEEVITARKFVDLGGAFSVPYSDVDSLVELLARLANDKSGILSCAKALDIFEYEFVPFDLQLNSILRNLIG